MIDDGTATETRWWNEHTTQYEIVRYYAENCGLTPENIDRFVAAVKDHFDGATLKQVADREGVQVESVYGDFWDIVGPRALAGLEADYYTVEQVARHALKHLYFDPEEPGSKGNAFLTVQSDLKWLVQRCDDDVRLCALQAAKRALDRLMSDEFQAVLLGIAGIDAEFMLDSSHLESTQPDISDSWAWATDY